MDILNKRAVRLSRVQRRIMKRLQKYSFETPYVTNNAETKVELLQLEDLGLVECQWSEDLGKAILFAWIPCEFCIRGICLADHSVDGVVPFEHCDHCGRYAHDLDAAEAIDSVTPVVSLDLTVDDQRSFGFDTRKLESVYNYLYHQLAGRSL